MVTKIKKSIDNSKRKGDFKKRQTMRIEKKQRQNKAESMEFVDKREIIKAKKRSMPGGGRNEMKSKRPVEAKSDDDDDDEMDDAELE